MYRYTREKGINDMKRITKKWIGKRPVIMFDYDDVLFDFLGTVLLEYNRRMGTSLIIEDITDWDLGLVGDIHIFMDIIKDASLWYQMKPKKDAIQVVQRLINDGHYTILICTACTTLKEYLIKVEVIEQVLPGFDTSKILSITDKHLIRGDLIIDDKIENLDKCAVYMNCILMDMPHNRDCNKYTRITNLSELDSLLECMFEI